MGKKLLSTIIAFIIIVSGIIVLGHLAKEEQQKLTTRPISNESYSDQTASWRSNPAISDSVSLWQEIY